MPKAKKPPQPPKKPTATEKMIEQCVKKAQARKRSGKTDSDWRQQYAATIRCDAPTIPLSQTPFAGSTEKKKP